MLASTGAILGAATLGGVVSAQDDVGVEVSVADSEIEGDEETELTVTITNVPDAGLTGWTFFVEMTGDGEAVFSGDDWTNDEVGMNRMDHDTDSAASAYVIGNDPLDAIDSSRDEFEVVRLGVVGAEPGDVQVDLRVDELWDGDDEPIDPTVTTDSFTVASASTGGLPSPGGDSDTGSSGTDGDDGDDEPVPTDGDDGTASDGDDASDDDAAGDDGATEGEADGASDGQPGFGVGAALVAVATGAAARYLRTNDDTESV